MRSLVVFACALATGCLVSVDLSGTEFRCADGACPDGLVCNDNNICVAATDTDAGDDGESFASVLTVGGVTGSHASFPLRVRLDGSRIDFAKTDGDGGDIFFTDENGNQLAHEVERWDPPEAAEFWVLVPTLAGGETITMHFGGRRANASSLVWGAYRSVFHLNRALDSSQTYAEVVDNNTTEVSDAIIGNGRGFAGGYFDLGANVDFLAASSAVTISAWVRRGSGLCNDDCTVFGASVGDGNQTLSRATLDLGQNGTPNLGIRDDDALGATSARGPTPLAIGEWTWLVGTADLAGDRVAVYVNGALATETVGAGLSGSFESSPSLQVALGSDENLAGGLFLGDIDELRVRLDARPPDWIAAQYLSLTDGLLAYAPYEME